MSFEDFDWVNWVGFVWGILGVPYVLIFSVLFRMNTRKFPIAGRLPNFVLITNIATLYLLPELAFRIAFWETTPCQFQIWHIFILFPVYCNSYLFRSAYLLFMFNITKYRARISELLFRSPFAVIDFSGTDESSGTGGEDDPKYQREVQRTMRTFWVKHRRIFKPSWLLQLNLLFAGACLLLAAIFSIVFDMYDDDRTGPDCKQPIILYLYFLGAPYATVVFIIGLSLRKVVDGFGIRSELAIVGCSWVLLSSPLPVVQLFWPANKYVILLPLLGYTIVFTASTPWQVYRVYTYGGGAPKLRAATNFRERSVHMDDLNVSASESTTNKDEVKAAIKGGLTAALKNEDARNEFKSFLMKEFAIENLLFWEVVTKFETLPEVRLPRQAKKIRGQFIEDTGMHPINIDSAMKAAIFKHFDDESYDRGMFKDAKDHVFRLMEESPFQRFARGYLASH